MFMKILKKLFGADTERTMFGQLPVEESTLSRLSKMLNLKTLKHIGIAALVGTTVFSFLSTLGHMRAYSSAMAWELKKQLDPVNKKLDELEEQNEELRRQNEQMRKELKEMR